MFGSFTNVSEVRVRTTARRLWFALLVIGCSAGSTLSDSERAGLAESVEHAVTDFQNAQRRLNAEQAVGHLAPSFYMYIDGMRQDYETTVGQIRTTMSTLRHFATEWSNVEVTVLGRDAATVSLVFRDSIVDASGETTMLRGVSTLVWRRDGSAWKIVYADADHYPISSPADST
jgi:hypothetical protein